MAKTTFTLRIPGLDITNIEGCRNTLIGIFETTEFEGYVRGFELNRVTLENTAPAPRGGDVSFGCHADSSGGWGCQIGGSIRF